MEQQRKKTPGWKIALIITATLVVIYAISGEDHKSETKEPPVSETTSKKENSEVDLRELPAYKDYSAQANTAIRIEAEKMLKAPSTADFPWADGLPEEITTIGVKLSDMSPNLRTAIKELRRLGKENDVRVYQKKSYVDAQNSFGAKLRQHYLGTYIVFIDNGNTMCFVEFYPQ